MVDLGSTLARALCIIDLFIRTRGGAQNSVVAQAGTGFKSRSFCLGPLSAGVIGIDNQAWFSSWTIARSAGCCLCMGLRRSY